MGNIKLEIWKPAQPYYDKAYIDTSHTPVSNKLFDGLEITINGFHSLLLIRSR